MTDALALAQSLLAQQLAPLPVLASNKRAIVKWAQWQADGIPADQLPGLFARNDLTTALICGGASRNLVVFDCDTHASLDRLRRAFGDPDTWIVASARGGHIYFHSPVPVRSTTWNGVEILAQGHYVLAPGALHPTGIHYEYLKHPPFIQSLNTLTPLPGLVLEPARIRPTGMPRKAWRILTGQAVEREYATESEREYAAVCSLVNKGFGFARVRDAFHKLAPPDGHYATWARKNGAADADEMLERMYHKALEWTSSQDSPDRRTAKRVRAWLENHPLTGRTGISDHVVLDAHLQIALRCGKLLYAASARDLAEIAGVAKETASHANHRLVARGLLEHAQDADGPFAHRWRLKPPGEVLRNLYTPPQELNVRECIVLATPFAHDAFHRKGLGKPAALVWTWLLREPLTLAELTARTGRHKSTISRVLAKLHDALHLIEPCEIAAGGAVRWQIVSGTNLDAVAHLLETSGSAKRRASDHERQRAAYRRLLAHREGAA